MRCQRCDGNEHILLKYPKHNRGRLSVGCGPLHLACKVASAATVEESVNGVLQATHLPHYSRGAKPTESFYFSDDEFENVRTAYFEARDFFDGVITAATKESLSAETAVVPSRLQMVRLPPLALRTFNGQLLEWLNFRNLFWSPMDGENRLSEIEKLGYLKVFYQSPAVELMLCWRANSIQYNSSWWKAAGYSSENIEEAPNNTAHCNTRISSDWEVKLGTSKDVLSFQLLEEFLAALLESADMMVLVGTDPVPERREARKTIVHHAQDQVQLRVCISGYADLFSCETFRVMGVTRQRGLMSDCRCCFKCLRTRHRVRQCHQSLHKNCGQGTPHVVAHLNISGTERQSQRFFDEGHDSAAGRGKECLGSGDIHGSQSCLRDASPGYLTDYEAEGRHDTQAVTIRQGLTGSGIGAILHQRDDCAESASAPMSGSRRVK
ncbi:hypothetical protein KM043_017655 [Ampulex compressa]|nr:hypothetical protein KM043_017655 [Ampulex compressa]